MNVYYKNVVSKIDSNGNLRCLCIGGKDSFEASKIDVIHIAEYYITECGYNCVLEIEECCPICSNEGKIWKGRKHNRFLGKWIPCPNCDGKTDWDKWTITI
jgi:hypothetical protein